MWARRVNRRILRPRLRGQQLGPPTEQLRELAAEVAAGLWKGKGR